LIYHNCYWGYLSWNSHYFCFFHIHFQRRNIPEE